jgi:glycosyltransferase involved in cell wall biosynthesis
VPADRFTFLVPYQRASTGGVYVISELARNLATEADVTLVVGRGELSPLPGVRVIPANGLDPAGLPDADVLVGGLAQRPVDQVLALPGRVGVPVFFFQGYGKPGSPVVREALERRLPVLPISHFLAEDAWRAGCLAEPIALGLDRGLFAPGTRAETRAPIVVMISHKTDWKGTEDGIAALRHVREVCPEVEIRIFGHRRGDLPGRFVEGLDGRRDLIGELLRRAAIFVLPSWEEGLGLPGIEALACGAALASTDTKGGRDYAHDMQTALISPPRDPDALARNIVRLLRDPRLRGALAAEGQRQVLERYPPWPEAAVRFRAAVERLTGAARAVR